MIHLQIPLSVGDTPNLFPESMGRSQMLDVSRWIIFPTPCRCREGVVIEVYVPLEWDRFLATKCTTRESTSYCHNVCAV